MPRVRDAPLLRRTGSLVLATLVCAAVGPFACNTSTPGSNGDYTVRAGVVSIEVDPRVGARIVSLSVDGSNWLTGPSANATNFGSTFWTSPQSDWNWPPPPEIDNLAYGVTSSGARLTLRGAESPTLGVRVTKTFAPGADGQSIAIQYAIENESSSPRSVAPWEVTRVHGNGLVFFPQGESAHSASAAAPLPTQDVAGVTWFNASAASISTSVKYFADGSRGWLAHANDGFVFVKKFVDVPAAAQAPGEAEIEIYVSGDHAYVELEAQGAYQSVAPGASLGWGVTWFLARIPSGVDASVGSASLVAFVDGL